MVVLRCKLRAALLIIGLCGLPICPPETRADSQLAPGQVFRDCTNCPEMIVIPAGHFLMGSPRDEKGHIQDEEPQHEVTISKPFAAGRFEVTIQEYRLFFEETLGKVGRSCWTRYADGEGNSGQSPSLGWDDPGLSWVSNSGRNTGGKDNHQHDLQVHQYRQSDREPVICVSWNDAKAYVAWLSEKTGKHYRLLTEAEWEYAARAGTTGEYPWEGGIDRLCQQANGLDESWFQPSWWDSRITVTRPRCNDGFPFTAPVGSFPQNAFGLFDMIGNVGEWLEDCYRTSAVYGPSYLGVPPDGSANISSCMRGIRSVRGGDWNSDAYGLRAAARTAGGQEERLYHGFRVARDL